MNRIEFISRGLALSAGAASGLAFAGSRPPRRHPLYFDGMSFLGGTEEDPRDSGLSGVLWDVSAGERVGDEFVRTAPASLKSLAAAGRFLRREPQRLFLATKGSQVRAAYRSGGIAVFLQLQGGGEALSQDLGMMEVFYELGMRVLQLTHHRDNALAGGCLEREPKGLSGLGREAVERMNALGIIPDAAHGSERTGLDLAAASRRPVIVSHTGCRALVDSARCTPDSVIRAVADSGGVVGIFSMSCWLTEEAVPTVGSYVRQLEHVIRVGGIEAVGIANDFDIAGDVEIAATNNDNEKAVKEMFPWWQRQRGLPGFDQMPRHVVIPELNDIRRLFTIQAALEKLGYRAAQVEKIMGGNWLRVYTECLG
jgi:membrane dipeptidase